MIGELFASGALVMIGVVTVELVHVGAPGNPPDVRFTTPGYGAVAYEYDIAKYEITAGQYAAFLNAVAASDSFGLYNVNMVLEPDGCRIERSGSAGSYSYSVGSEWADRPVNFVSWENAARFANWMHNGQPSGPQSADTTERGSYDINGGTSLGNAVRRPEATWVIPSEDEWYKAAYHANNGPTGDYWDYPTGVNIAPANELLYPDAGNSANFRNGPTDYTLGVPFYRTVVGEFENSAGRFGTFDQGGNVSEWNEVTLGGQLRCIRGGSWDGPSPSRLHAATRIILQPLPGGHDDIGFRLVKLTPPGANSEFVDDFNRSNGSPGNGWSIWGNGADIVNGELRTFGQNNVAGGVVRVQPLMPGRRIHFSFDIRTDDPGGGGWELDLNSTTTSYINLDEFHIGERLVVLRQYTGISPVYFVVGSSVVAATSPANPRFYSSSYSHISGDIESDLSVTLIIDHLDGGPIDTLTFPAPGVNPLSVPQGPFMLLGNSSAYFGPHYFDNLVVSQGPGGVPGDMNCDGVVSVGDIRPFVIAITDPPSYIAQFPDCDYTLGDINSDGFVSVSDIGPFVALLIGS